MEAKKYARLAEEQEHEFVAVDRPSLTDSKMVSWSASDLATMNYPLTPQGEHVRRDVAHAPIRHSALELVISFQ